VAAADLTRQMLAEGRRLQAHSGCANVAFCQAEALRLPFAAERFDVVTCRRAAHHFTDIGGALREMLRVLRPGGRLVIDDRSVPDDDAVDTIMNHLDRLHDASHVRQYRPAEWTAMAAAAGLEVACIEPYTRQRPVSSLTQGVAPAEAAEIHRILAALGAQERAAIDVAEKDGQLWCTHWYVLLSGVKPAPRSSRGATCW
jgi:SAM-dependent methyltransferase